MGSTRSLTLLVGLGLSIVVSIALSVLFEAPVFLLVLPFIPLLGWRRSDQPPRKKCATCGFETREQSIAFCPRDGTELEEVDP